jgi:hypothetical protein
MSAVISRDVFMQLEPSSGPDQDGDEIQQITSAMVGVAGKLT